MSDSATLTAACPLLLDVVSVQSQVIYGRVGNNVAIPALTGLGLSVAAVPTVLFSNTPHYPTLHGGALPGEWFDGYLQDLEARGALNALRGILIGYLGNPHQAQTLARWVRARLKDRPTLHIVIDPVIGDHDCGVYVDAKLVDIYRQALLPLAEGLTPNGFELAYLTGLPVHDIDSVVVAARMLLKGRTKWIAVTSAAPEIWTREEMLVVFVTRTQVKVISHPRIDVTVKGTGDLFCATLLGYWLNGAVLAEAVVYACRQVVRALLHTKQRQCAELLFPPKAGAEIPIDDSLVRVDQDPRT